jgi:hypothetical protein
MRDPSDDVTRELLGPASGAERQAAFKARQQALGRRQRPLWLTDDELHAVKWMINQVRKGGVKVGMPPAHQPLHRSDSSR